MDNYRPPTDFYFLRMAELVSERGTCARRKVGCVFVNKKNHVIATGYNRNPSGFIHCIDKNCEGAKSKSGTDLDKCEAIHAEQNALLQCKDVHEIDRECIVLFLLVFIVSSYFLILLANILYFVKSMFIEMLKNYGY